MDKDDLKGIIEFAIQKEQEAVDFYTDLALRVRIVAVREELASMAAMEAAHREKLRHVNLADFTVATPSRTPDLKIANYTVDAIPHEDMSWHEVINIAMHRELAALNLYRDLAASTADEALRNLFENLAGEEEKHKLYLETIWDEKVMKDN